MPDANDEIDNGPTDASPAGVRWNVADTLLLALLSLLALGLRLVGIGQWSFGVVEAETFRALTQPLFAGPDSFAASGQSTYPAVFLLLRSLLEIGALPGFTEGWIRLPFAFAGCLLVPSVALFARPQFGRGVACLSALVIAVHPGHIAASQTADPIVFVMTLAVFAGAALLGGKRRVAVILAVLAGACHPIGWLCGVGMLCAAATDRVVRKTPPWGWWLLLLLVIVLVPSLLDVVGMSLPLLAVIAVLIRPQLANGPNSLGLALATLGPLLVGGIWWWLGGIVVASASIATLAPLTVLASWAVVRFWRRLHEQHAQDEHRRWVMRLLMTAPAIMLLGELATAAFLYFAVFSGARPPWREVRNVVLAKAASGHQVEVIAARGCDVMRAYLRPRHWREPVTDSPSSLDPHPGMRVSPLPKDAVEAQQLLSLPDAMLVLQNDELRALQNSAAGRTLVGDFVVVEVWPSPQRSGDQSVYLLQRR
tara:strand:- start:7600 stop:9039 length:1440 start_codon:yes stop_codon:yes gene_type:complete